MYPAETVWQAFALFLDHVPFPSIERVLSEHTTGDEESPTKATIAQWSRDGEITDGVNWRQIRDLTDTIRGRGAIEIANQSESLDTVQWRERSKVQVEMLQVKAFEAVMNGQAKISASDIPKFVHLRQELDVDRDQEIKEITVQVLGRLIYLSKVEIARMRPELKDGLDEFMALIGENFARFEAFNGSLDDFIKDKIDGKLNKRIEE